MTIEDLIDWLELIKCAKGNVDLKDLAYIKVDDANFYFEHHNVIDSIGGKYDKYLIEFSPNMMLKCQYDPNFMGLLK
jgi:hypothetical protein